MPEYYAEFKTWAEGRIETPWPFVWFEEIGEYRHRDDPAQPIDDRKTRSAFMSFDQERINRFLSEHVAGVILGAVVVAPHPDSAVRQIKQVFGSCEMLGICEVNEGNRNTIEEVMKKSKA